jgi:Domain of unknown function (DUF4149)
MHVLRFAAVLAIAVWLGGLVVLGGVAAPAIFAVVTARDVVDGRTLSGAIFGEALRRFHLVAYACGAVILLSLIARRILGPRPRRFAIRFAAGLVMVGATLYSGLVLLPNISRVREEIGAGLSVTSLPAGDPRRITFERLHERSRLVQLIPLAGACALLFLELSDPEG